MVKTIIFVSKLRGLGARAFRMGIDQGLHLNLTTKVLHARVSESLRKQRVTLRLVDFVVDKESVIQISREMDGVKLSQKLSDPFELY